jgi:hypothetical protein
MLLNVIERITLLGILPEQGNFITLKIVRELREALAFDEEEIYRLELNQADGKITWNPAKDTCKEVSVGDKAFEIIAKGLEKLNDDQKLTQQHYNLYEHFVGLE